MIVLNSLSNNPLILRDVSSVTMASLRRREAITSNQSGFTSYMKAEYQNPNSRIRERSTIASLRRHGTGPFYSALVALSSVKYRAIMGMLGPCVAVMQGILGHYSADMHNIHVKSRVAPIVPVMSFRTKRPSTLNLALTVFDR